LNGNLKELLTIFFVLVCLSSWSAQRGLKCFSYSNPNLENVLTLTLERGGC
jgi:hypothetical protein